LGLGGWVLIVEGWLVGLVLVVSLSSVAAVTASALVEEAEPGCPLVDKAGCTGGGYWAFGLVVRCCRV